jgi:transformation/transcription domain-associated protein
MKPSETSISESVIRLMKTCPGESLSTRKELLVATRHILATDFREGFYPQVDVLLNESVLIGDGRQFFETLRPMAYSTLADLIHHVMSHVCVHIYLCVCVDSFLKLSTFFV